MKSDEAKRLRTLEIGNQRLKEMLAEAKPYKRILKTAWEGNYGARHVREAVNHVQKTCEVSQRRACKTFGQPLGTQRYRSG